MTASIGTTNDDFSAMARQPDGKIVSVGSTGSSNLDFLVFRFNPDGSLDTSFDFDGAAVTPIGTGNDGAGAVAIQSDGRILVAGHAFIGAFEDFAVARYNPDGSLDATFDADGKVVTPVGSSSDRATGVLIQTDSRIVVTGTVLNNSNNNDFAAVRYNTDGSLDNSLYGTGGKTIVDLSGADDSAVSSLLDNFGRAVLAGTSGGEYGVLRLFGDLVPTASNVSVSGRILTSGGAGLRNAVVTLTDAKGASRAARSSTFGYYRFDGVRAGETYVVTVASKRYLFAPRVLSVEEDLTNVDFIPVSGDDARFNGSYD